MRIYNFVRFLIVSVAILFSSIASAKVGDIIDDTRYMDEKPDVTYRILSENPNTVEVYAFSNNGDHIIIPSILTTMTDEEYEVVSVRESAFKNTTLKAITLPKTVTKIGDYAFADCKELKKVNLPETLTHLGGYAFYNCGLISSIKLPTELIEIGDYCFAYCQSLSTVIIPENVTDIKEYAFCGCPEITTFVIGENVRRMGEGILSGNFKLSRLYSLPWMPPKTKFISNGGYVDLGYDDPWHENNHFPFNPSIYVLPHYILDYRKANGWMDFDKANYHEIPYSFAVFDKDIFTVERGKSINLDYKIIFADYRDEVSLSWSVFNPAAVSINEGVATGLVLGERTRITLTVTDPYGNSWDSYCWVQVENIADEPTVSIDNCEIIDGIYNLNGLRVGDTTEGLAPGLYIVREGSSTRKVMVR